VTNKKKKEEERKKRKKKMGKRIEGGRDERGEGEGL